MDNLIFISFCSLVVDQLAIGMKDYDLFIVERTLFKFNYKFLLNHEVVTTYFKLTLGTSIATSLNPLGRTC